MSKDGQLIWDHRRATGDGRQGGQLWWYWGSRSEDGWESDHDSEKPTSISVPMLVPVSPFPGHFTVPLELITATSLTISFWDLHTQRAHCESQAFMMSSLVKLPGFGGNFYYLSRICLKSLILTLGTQLGSHGCLPLLHTFAVRICPISSGTWKETRVREKYSAHGLTLQTPWVDLRAAKGK